VATPLPTERAELILMLGEKNCDFDGRCRMVWEKAFVSNIDLGNASNINMAEIVRQAWPIVRIGLGIADRYCLLLLLHCC